MKKRLIAVIGLGVLMLALGVGTAEARLSSYEAKTEARWRLVEYYAGKDWTEDWSFYGCNRQGASSFGCSGPSMALSRSTSTTRLSTTPRITFVRGKAHRRTCVVRLEAGVRASLP